MTRASSTTRWSSSPIRFATSHHTHTPTHPKDPPTDELAQTAAQLYEEPDGYASADWHSDLSTERIPADYSAFKMLKLPDKLNRGGDTLWACCYEAFDRLSPPWKRFAESLTATHRDDTMNMHARRDPSLFIAENRGSPENCGLDFTVSQ